MKLIEQIKNLGAHNAAIVEVSDIPFEPSLIDMCKMNTCGNYGKSWVCPPLSGEIDDLIARAKQYKRMLVFQAVYPLEDSFDIEGMFAANESFRKLTVDIDRVCRAEWTDILTLSAGKCAICDECGAITNEPCRAPDRAYAALEAYGIFVSKLAEVSGIKYINGVNTVTYFGGILFN
ncbi:MAG: DUF2284 domain-containing protein [Oscillospiraceae bacterium]|nr:DUF2284 domain-containing protein [Oscillospiraceae bacterium]